jgi:hypothetical protein
LYKQNNLISGLYIFCLSSVALRNNLSKKKKKLIDQNLNLGRKKMLYLFVKTPLDKNLLNLNCQSKKKKKN